jgi:hypothetical protein
MAAAPAQARPKRPSTPAPTPALRAAAAPAPPPDSPIVLMLSNTFKMPYRVMRCAAAAGARVHILSTSRGADLALSRCCQGLTVSSRAIDGQFDPELASEINALTERLGIDLVMAGDALSTRSLIAVRPLLAAPSFPMPNLAQFDLLNDKSRFTDLCRSLGIECPRTRLYADVSDLRRDLLLNTLDFPAIAKPLGMNGAVGCITLERETAHRRLADIFYSPILVQQFIEGEDIGASVYCEHGEIKAFIAHKYGRARYSTFPGHDIHDTLAAICRHMKLSGVYNFDMRLTPDGRVIYLECNPRFFYKIAMSMLAGVNFVELGLPGRHREAPARPPRSGAILFPKALAAALLTPWKLEGRIWPALAFILADLIPNLREAAGLEDHTGEFGIPA